MNAQRVLRLSMQFVKHSYVNKREGNADSLSVAAGSAVRSGCHAWVAPCMRSGGSMGAAPLVRSASYAAMTPLVGGRG